MGGIKEPTFKINPRFRLTKKHLSVVWHCVDKFTLELFYILIWLVKA